MMTFQVKDMTCGGCASGVTRAVKSVEATAEVRVDLGRRLVSVDAPDAAAEPVAAAIREAGFTPERVPV